MKKNLISICIPYRNSPEYLDDLFASIKQQTYKNYEIIVCDDQSTKENRDKLENKLSDYFSNYKIVLGKGKGLFMARQVAMKSANGEIILNADSDDMYLGNGFFEYINTVFNYTNFEIFIFGACDFIDDYKNSKLINAEVSSVISSKVSKLFQYRAHQVSKSIPKEEFYKNSRDLLSSLKCESLDKEFLINVLMTIKPYQPVWDKAISSSLVKYFLIDEVDNITSAEDRLFTFLMFLYSKKIVWSHCLAYYYRRHSLSSSTSGNPIDYCRSCIETEKRIETLFKQFPQYRYESIWVSLSMIDCFIRDTWKRNKNINKFIEQVKQIKEINKYKQILNEYPKAYRRLKNSIKLYCYNYLFSEQYLKLYFFVKHKKLYIWHRAILNSKIVPNILKETRKVYIPKLGKYKFFRIRDK